MPDKPVRVRKYRQRRAFTYDPDTGAITEEEEPEDRQTRPRRLSDDSPPKGFVYDEVRGEYYHPDTGEVYEASVESEAAFQARPMFAPSVERRKYYIARDIACVGLKDITRLGYGVNAPEGDCEEPGSDPRFAESEGPVAFTGEASDADIGIEFGLLYRKTRGKSGMGGVSRRGIAGALAILAVYNRRRRIVQPSEIIALDPDYAAAYFEEDEEKFNAEREEAEDEIRKALRIIRARLRES